MFEYNKTSYDYKCKMIIILDFQVTSYKLQFSTKLMAKEIKFTVINIRFEKSNANFASTKTKAFLLFVQQTQNRWT